MADLAEIIKRAKSLKANQGGPQAWHNSVLDYVLSLEGTSTDTQRCIDARNKLNAAIHGEGAVIDDLERIIDRACAFLAKPGVQVCCQKFDTCRELCVPRADHWQALAAHLASVSHRRAMLLHQVLNLCAIGDIDENSDDGLGWAGFVREAKNEVRDHVWHPQPQCALPPAGWTCSRAKGHEGPCAASPKEPSHG